MSIEVRDFKENDPVPDVFGHYPIGYVLKMPDGRLFVRGAFGDWLLQEETV